ncbi:MAG TPA: GNAT family N-acetyltransferase [Acidimicrobiales bacterium]|jgi:GNAT superfamily N-acetyltransferase
MTPHESTRVAGVADLEVLVPLAEAAIAEKREQKGGLVWMRRESRGADVRASLAAALEARDHLVVLGLLDDTPLGYGVAHVETLADGGRLGVLEDLYVDPGARAVGVGEVLMDHLLGWCREQGCFGVDSLALPGDRSTKNFFESFGLVARAIVVHRPLQDS